MLKDIRFALRQLFKQPGFTFIAIMTLALAIGATTAVLSLVNALLVRPLPYREPQQLVLLLQHFKSQNLERIPVSPPEFVDYETRAHTFEKLGAFSYTNFNLAGEDKPERISGATVTAAVLPLLGVSPIKGRLFEPEECTLGRDDVVIISARLWQRRFNSDPQIIGTKLLLNGKSFTVVGVMPASFDFPLQLFNLGNGGQFGGRAEIWQPLAFTDDQMKARYSRGFAVIGRLAPGASVAKAQAEIETINAQMRREHPNNYSQDNSFGGDAFPLQGLAVGGMRPALLILVTAVFLVLLIACANLTTMLLARAAAREREMAIRVALGAGPLRLLKQVLTESVLLALIGGVAGVLLALWGVESLKVIGAQTVPRLREVNVDLGVLGVTLAIAVGTGIIFGLVPGLASARPELTEALKEGSRGSTQGTSRNRLRNGLVIAEVALALVLLSGAGLLMKSFARLQNVNAGFNPRNVLTFEVSLPKIQYPNDPSIVRFNNEAQRRLAALPGVRAAGFSTILPLAGTNGDSSFAIEGRQRNDRTPSPDEEKRQVSRHYFRALEIPLIKGRFFTDADNADAPPVIIVNQAFAKKFWPNQEALGKRIVMGGMSEHPNWITIVGVVGDVRHFALDVDPKPEMYIPFAQDAYFTTIYVVRSNQDPGSLLPAIRREIQAIDSAVPLANVRTFESVVADSVAPRRLSVVLLGVFAGVAVLLASVGIYGVMSFLVVQRTQEIGVRMALGAQRSDVLKLILGHSVKLISAGAMIGLVVALMCTGTLRALLYNVSAFDTATFVLVSIFLAAVALAASYLPAMRATKADPMVALHAE
ncbi:MAG TPA: ABC transporter permease [Candidatus Udaeobacter sp.]|jgi:putative ABC transport system permease protein|nr:ABC transporter permease [Candidatus Udaeobacter sp.]